MQFDDTGSEVTVVDEAAGVAVGAATTNAVEEAVAGVAPCSTAIRTAVMEAPTTTRAMVISDRHRHIKLNRATVVVITRAVDLNLTTVGAVEVIIPDLPEEVLRIHRTMRMALGEVMALTMEDLMVHTDLGAELMTAGAAVEEATEATGVHPPMDTEALPPVDMGATIHTTVVEVEVEGINRQLG